MERRARYNLKTQQFLLRDYWIFMEDACSRLCAGVTRASEKLASKGDSERRAAEIKVKVVKIRQLHRKYFGATRDDQLMNSPRSASGQAATATNTPAIPSPPQHAASTPSRAGRVKPASASRTCNTRSQNIAPDCGAKTDRLIGPQKSRGSSSSSSGNSGSGSHTRSSNYLPNLKSLLRSSSLILLFIILLLAPSGFQQRNARGNVVTANAQSYDSTAADVGGIGGGSQPAGPSPPAASSHQQQQQQQQQGHAPAAVPSQAESSPRVTTAAANNAACFGGLQTFEKISMSTFENPAGPGGGGGGGGASSGSGPFAFGSGVLIQQDDQALTSECINLCRSQANCLSFVIDYNKFECKSYATTQQELQQEFAAKFQSSSAAARQTNASLDSTDSLNGYQTAASSNQANLQQLLPSASSNYFEKICLDGVANRNQFGDVCGPGRLWTVERVVDTLLDGFVEKEVTNVSNKDECSKLCLFETQFVCRSADYDQHSRLCRLSKEDRRTQPQAMRHVPNSNRQYLENQCATPGPSSCVYETKRNVGIISMDALKFAQTAQDCQMKCNLETSFNCRSYSFHQQRCFLSGDDSVSLNSNLIKLPQKQGWTFGEKRCLVELCSKGIFSYEKITGFTLRSALATSIDLMVPASSTSFGATSGEHGGGGGGGGGAMGAFENLHQEASQTTKLRHLMPPVYNQVNSSSLASAMMMLMSASSNDLQRANNLPSRYAEPLLEAASTYGGSGGSGGGGARRQARGTSNLAITEHCRHSCDLGYLNCPAFTIDYKNNRCQRLDRNSQGRHHELVARDGFAYYEKICLRVPEIMSMCQDKYWIFERVIGYELAPRLYDKALKFVQSRRDCEEYCLEEKQFQCRSAMYNDETSDCKLSRYNRRLAIQEGGYYRNFNARISYLENNCVRDHQLDREQQCYYEQARDEPAYPTFTERIEMASPMATHEAAPMATTTTTTRFNASQSPSATPPTRFGSSFCEQLCNDNSKFECHSFGYYASTAQCFLSGDDSISAGELATTPSTGFTYYEKKCRMMPPAPTANNQTDDNQGDSRGMGANPIPATPTSSQNPYFQPPMQSHSGNAGAGAGSSGGSATGSGVGSGTIVTTPMSEIMGTTTALSDPSATATNSNNNNMNANTDLRPNPAGARPHGTGHQGGGGGGGGGANGSANQMDPDLYKCGVGHTYVYQRISGFEPIGGYLTLLVKNNEQPGIVAECADLCKRAFECRAFVVDYNSNQCFAMLENSSVGLLSLRQTLGMDYFEGFCLANHLLLAGAQCRNRTWVVDKIVDQAVVGVQHQRLVPDSDRFQCRQACFEERLFWCKSAMFDSATGDCKLYSVDRESMPQMRLLFTKGVDFFENQCQISSSACPYDAIERDMTIITTTKSLQARSTFDCELACNSELTFNCRSYTYLDQYPSLPNLCLLSSDSRSTSQRGSVKEHQKTLYAERNCYYRKPRYPGGSSGGGGGASGLSHKYDTIGYSPSPISPPSPSLSTPLNSLDPYRISSSTGSSVPPPDSVLSGGGGGSGGGSYSSPPSTAPMMPAPPLRVSTEQEGGPAGPYEQSLGATLGAGCEPHQFTFERTFGYDFKLAAKERAPIAPTIGIAIGCQQECLRRGERCQSFVVEYALPYQSCFLIESQVGANKRLLVKAPNSAYFEKLCLPRTGVQGPPEPLTQAPVSSMEPPTSLHQMAADAQSLDTSPGYSQEPWSLQAPNQLPYYLQQQQHVQNYPSRACSKLWSFERFVNHNFTAPVDRQIENSLNRAHCETQCLNEASFSCRAATYDYANKICRLFRNTRRTVLSHFVDLESGQQQSQAPQSNGAGPPNLPDSHPGTAHVLTGEPPSPSGGDESIQTSASSVLQTNSLGAAKSARASARQLGAQTSSPSQQTGEPSSLTRNIDYLENTCTPEPSSCQYRQIYDQFSPYIDRVNHAVSLGDCQRQCDQERLFGCKSLNYDPVSRNCMLVNEDLISLNRGASQQSALLPKKNTIYSEKGNCEMISVQCNSQEMLVAINFDAPFRGRVMAKGNPEQCFMLGDGQTSVQFSIVFGPKCNSRQEGHNTFVNEVVIQQHPVIMTESDKTVRVMCAFEAPDQTITLKNPMSRDNKTGIDVGTPETSRTRHDKQQFNSVISNKAAPPSVLLRILDPNGRDASMINLGDDLVLKIQMQMDGTRNSALGIFARNLAARSSNGESLLLIDNDGCPVDPQVFPALEIDSKDGKSLVSTFKAFRFPSSGLVNFEVQIRFCPERCQPVDCHKSPGQRARSYGRRRKRQAADESGAAFQAAFLESKRAPILQSVGDDQQLNVPQAPHQPLVSLDSLSTVMKPGKAFEYVRKLMLSPSTEAPPPRAPQAMGTTESLEPSQNQAPDLSAATTDANIQPNASDQSAGGGGGDPQNQLAEPNGPKELPVGEDFDNPATGLASAEPRPVSGGDLSHPSGFPQTVASSTQDQVPNIDDQATDSAMAGPNLGSQQISTSSQQHKSILLHVDEKVLPAQHQQASDFAPTSGLSSHPQTLAPYGRFPTSSLADSLRPPENEPTQVGAQHQSADSTDLNRPSLSETPNNNNNSNNNNNNDDEQLELEPGRSKAPVESGSESGATSSGFPHNSLVTSSPLDLRGERETPTTASNFHPIDPPRQQQQQQQQRRPIPTPSSSTAFNPSTSNKDMPLRFSILVGENQPPTNGRQDQPSVLIMNSTNMELDHIVIPGRKGQLDDGEQIGSTNSLAASNYQGGQISLGYPQQQQHQQTDAVGLSRHRKAGEAPSKRNASYEQTFDALPSNSVPSEVHLNQADHNPHLAQHHHFSRDEPHKSIVETHASGGGGGGHGAKASAGTHLTLSPSESAASHDCQVEAGRSRLRTIIWTGGVVIALNICLVILSLVMYFRKVHLRQNHTIVRSNSDCGGTRRSGHGDGEGRANRWPSVILKSKNKLGTSLNTHEHFFCKLNNSKQTGPAAGLEHDFNWPNLSSSSSRSTISSLASPVPSTSIRVNQMRPSLKSAPFDAHSTLRSGNFNTGHPKGATALMDESDRRDEFVARYTNNIDILHSERF